MADAQQGAPQTNGFVQPKVESAADVQAQWSETMGNGAPAGEFISPADFAKLPQPVRHRLANARRAERGVEELRGQIGQMQTQWQQFMQSQQRAAQTQNGNGNGHANGKTEAPGLDAQPIDQLLSLRRRARQAERTYRANPEDANAAQIVNHPGFDEYLDNLDLAIQRKTAADAVKPLADGIRADKDAQGESYGVFTRLSQRYGAPVVGNPDGDLFKKAAEIRAARLAAEGIDAGDPAQAKLVTMVTEMAWAQAEADMNRAGRGQGDPNRRRLESNVQPQLTNSGAPQVSDRMNEISALIAQGERGKAHDLAMQEFNETRMLHPAFNAQARTAR